MALGKQRFNVRPACPKDKLKFKFFSSPVCTVSVWGGGGGGIVHVHCVNVITCTSAQLCMKLN